MKIIGIVGSPRKNGNTDILVNEVLEGPKENGAEVERIFLNDLDFRECQACDGCRVNGNCVLDDDMSSVYRKLIEADGIVLGTPVYFLNVTAQLKKFIDRCRCLFNDRFESKLNGKKGVVVAVCGNPDITMTGSTVSNLMNIMRFSGMDFVGSVEGSAVNKGDIGNSANVMKKARSLGIDMTN